MLFLLQLGTSADLLKNSCSGGVNMLCVWVQVVSGRTSKAAGPFKEAVVFMIGGGNYLEYESLSLYASRSQPLKNILYGATEILSPEGFAKQLADLGKQSSAALA